MEEVEFNKRLNEFEAYIKCAKRIAEQLKDIIGVEISPFGISHNSLTFVKRDTISKKTFVFNECEAVLYPFTANMRDEYYAISPVKFNDGWVSMTLTKVEVLVSGKLKAIEPVRVAQIKVGV